jgi:hypothetical protein
MNPSIPACCLSFLATAAMPLAIRLAQDRQRL